jgi:hypothetical protein
MQISPKTLAVMTNFAAISDYIEIDPGNELTVVTNKGVLAKATVAENFPVLVRLYDLTSFLKAIGMFKAADCEFNETFVRIREADGDSEVSYRYAGPRFGHTKPRRLTSLPEERIELHLPQEKWAALERAASVLKKKEVRVISDGDDVRITTYDQKNSNGHEFSTPLRGTPKGRRCNTIFLLDNLKLLPGSYDVTVTRSYTVFKNVSGLDLTYWIGCDPGSTFK